MKWDADGNALGAVSFFVDPVRTSAPTPILLKPIVSQNPVNVSELHEARFTTNSARLISSTLTA